MGVPGAAGPSLCSWGTPLLPPLTKSECPAFPLNQPARSGAFPDLSAGSEAPPKGPIRPGKHRQDSPGLTQQHPGICAARSIPAWAGGASCGSGEVPAVSLVTPEGLYHQPSSSEALL